VVSWVGSHSKPACIPEGRTEDYLLLLQSVRAETTDARRRGLYRRAIVIALLGNTLLAIVKTTTAVLSGSSAVFSDAANSASDTLYSLLMAAGLYLSQQPADASHPQGHSRFEPIVSILISGAMFFAGLAALRKGYDGLRGSVWAISAGWPVAVLAFSGLVKVGMYALVRRVGHEAQSPAIQASAQDNLSDVLTTTTALVGVWTSRWLHPVLDPVAGLLVAVWILRTAGGVLFENLGYLTGRGASPELTDRMVKIAASVPGVLGVHQVICDHVGPQLRIDMHVDVDGNKTLLATHAIADEVERRLEDLPEVDLAFVHLEPMSLEQDSRGQPVEPSALQDLDCPPA
jgi:cation diffusion facilitator family transporter